MTLRMAVLSAAFAAFVGAAQTGPMEEKDVAYARPAGAEPVLLDLKIPAGRGPFPAAILVHGGGFDEGSKSTNVKPLFDVLTNAGYAWFSIDYRMAPKYHFAEAHADVAGAIVWVRANARKYRVDPKRIVLIGESAGGLLVNDAGTHETAKTKIAAVVDFYGPSDYLKLAEARRDHPDQFNMKSINRHFANGGGIRFFGAESLDEAGRAKLTAISPLHAVHQGMPPFLCIHGDKDDQVLYEQTPLFCDAIHKVSGVCDIVTISGGGHGMGGWKDPAMQHWKTEMIDWLNQTLHR